MTQEPGNINIQPTLLFSALCNVPIILAGMVGLFCIKLLGKLLSSLEIYISNIFLVAVAATLLIFLYKTALIALTRYTITNNQLITQQGILFKSTNFLELYRVKDYQLQESLFNQLTGTMTISLYSFDTTGTLPMIGIPTNPGLIETLRERVQLSRKTNHIVTFER
jgi:uncharacterized membrane protein YdbT with pleckstrin-like domain